MSLIPVYRALEILTTAAGQLSVHSERNGVRLGAAETPALIRRPSLDMSRADFMKQNVLSMAIDGNAFWLKKYGADRGTILDLVLLNPHEVRVAQDDSGKITFHYRGKAYSSADVVHLSKLQLPGRVRGLGPIQAAQAELSGAVSVRNYSAAWFDGSGTPSGVLTSDQVLNGSDADRFSKRWNGFDEQGEPLDRSLNPTNIKVLGKGTTFTPIMLNPADAQWLESRQFSTTDIARLFGVPASLMLAEIPGNSQAYSNVEQDWIAFTRFTLMGYLGAIEDALTDLVPRGQQARFNVEALLRSDTKSRYEGYEIGIRAGFMTVNEVREIEGRAPLTPAPASAPALATKAQEITSGN